MTRISLTAEQVVIRYQDEELETICDKLTEYGHTFQTRLRKRMFVKKLRRTPPELNVQSIIYIFQDLSIEQIGEKVIEHGFNFQQGGVLDKVIEFHLKKLQEASFDFLENKPFTPGLRKVVLLDTDTYHGHQNDFLANFEGAIHFYGDDYTRLAKSDLTKGIISKPCSSPTQTKRHQMLHNMFSFHVKTTIYLISQDDVLKGFVNYTFFVNRFYVL